MGTIVGVSGTQNGLTRKQVKVLTRQLRRLGDYVLLHGGCIGVDEEAHWIAAEEAHWTEVFPQDINKAKQADLNKKVWLGRVHPEAAPLRRNRTIVSKADEVIIVPKENQEVRRSGTWSTYRYAMLRGIPVTVIRPDGLIICHNRQHA